MTYTEYLSALAAARLYCLLADDGLITRADLYRAAAEMRAHADAEWASGRKLQADEWHGRARALTQALEEARQLRLAGVH